MQVTELTCPNCCAKLELDRSTGMAKCEFCDSTFVYNMPKQAVPKAESSGHRPAEKISYDTSSASSSSSDVVVGPITKQNLVWWILAFIFAAPIAITVLVAKSKLPAGAKAAIIAGIWVLLIAGVLLD